MKEGESFRQRSPAERVRVLRQEEAWNGQGTKNGLQFLLWSQEWDGEEKLLLTLSSPSSARILLLSVSRANRIDQVQIRSEGKLFSFDQRMTRCDLPL